jgi:hypothetical protein
MGRILSASPLDAKERGVVVHNEDHSTCLPPGRVHTRGYDMEQLQRSQLPDVGDEAQVGKLMISGTNVEYDPDRFQIDRAFAQRLEQDDE